MLAMLCFCTFKLSNFFLPNCQFLFCQATQFCSAKQNIFARGGQILQFCSAKLNDDSNTDKNGRKIGKYGRNPTKMAENRLNLVLGRKIGKIWRKRGMLAMLCF